MRRRATLGAAATRDAFRYSGPDKCSLHDLETAIGIGAAKAGYKYWSLVAMTVTLPLTACWWHSYLKWLTVYVASNLDKVLLGHFWGVDASGSADGSTNSSTFLQAN
jgi:hypothetical protein